MRLLEVGIGEFSVSSEEGSVIKTYALGSCVALVIYDSVNKVAGMIHIALPDSKINEEKATKLPGYFADTGLELLLKKMNEEGAKRISSWIKIIGGASVVKNCESFDIGKRNILAIRKILWNKNLGIKNEDVGGNFSRTVSIDITDGKVTISNGRNKWDL